MIETQKCRYCWDEWRITLADSDLRPLAEIPFLTPSGQSLSFANPKIRQINHKTFMISLFMPLEGNFRTEYGQLVYKVDLLEPMYEMYTKMLPKKNSVERRVPTKYRTYEENMLILDEENIAYLV